MQNNNFPYGEVDASSHYAVADFTTLSNVPIVVLPHYIDKRYGLDNNFKQHRLWYHPPYHMDLSIVQIASGERTTSLFILVALFSSVVVVVVFFLMLQWYGFVPALLSSLLLMFSGRDFMVFLWGQWPERISIVFVPLVLYAVFKYFLSVKEGNEKVQYVYIAAVLLSVNMFLHPVGFFHTLISLAIFFVFVTLKYKKMFFKSKHVLVAGILFLLLISVFPDQTGNVIARFSKDRSGDIGSMDVSRLFHWYKKFDGFTGAPDAYFSFGAMHGLWTLPLLLLGIFFLVMRRKDHDLVMLGWLVGLYIVLHLDVLGKNPFAHRSLAASAHIFAPLTAIGFMYLVSFTKRLKQRKVIAGLLIAVFVLFALNVNGKAAYNQLKGAYAGLGRVTPPQYEVAEWLRQNTLLEDEMSLFGPISHGKARWIWMLSHRYLGWNRENMSGLSYAVFDFSDLATLGAQQNIQQLQQVEQQIAHNTTKVYDRNFIRVYKLTG